VETRAPAQLLRPKTVSVSPQHVLRNNAAVVLLFPRHCKDSVTDEENPRASFWRKSRRPPSLRPFMQPASLWPLRPLGSARSACAIAFDAFRGQELKNASSRPLTDAYCGSRPALSIKATTAPDGLRSQSSCGISIPEDQRSCPSPHGRRSIHSPYEAT